MVVPRLPPSRRVVPVVSLALLGTVAALLLMRGEDPPLGVVMDSSTSSSDLPATTTIHQQQQQQHCYSSDVVGNSSKKAKNSSPLMGMGYAHETSSVPPQVDSAAAHSPLRPSRRSSILDQFRAHQASTSASSSDDESSWLCFCSQHPLDANYSNSNFFGEDGAVDDLHVCDRSELQPLHLMSNSSNPTDSAYTTTQAEAPLQLGFCVMQNVCVTRSRLPHSFDAGVVLTYINVYLSDERRRTFDGTLRPPLPAAIRDEWHYQTRVHPLSESPLRQGFIQKKADDGTPGAVRNVVSFDGRTVVVDSSSAQSGSGSTTTATHPSLSLSSPPPSFSLISSQLFHEVPYHGIHQNMFKAYSMLRLLTMPMYTPPPPPPPPPRHSTHTATADIGDLSKIPILDTFMLANNHGGIAIDAKGAFNFIRWNNHNNSHVSEMCFRGPVVVGNLPHLFQPFRDRFRGGFRQYILDTYHRHDDGGGSGSDKTRSAAVVSASGTIDGRCDRAPRGRILYIKRPCPATRCIFNTLTFENYLRTLESIGFNVTIAVFTSNIPLRDQVRMAADADIVLGPHGSGLIHASWLPAPCGVLVELFGRFKRAMAERRWFRSLMDVTGHSSHLSYFPEEEGVNVNHHMASMTIDLPHFHHVFAIFLTSLDWWQGFHNISAFGLLRVDKFGGSKKV